MRLNLWLVKVSQFLQQFKLDLCHKPGKKHIIPDVLSQLISIYIDQADLSYLKLNMLFTYNTTPVKIYLDLISKILVKYKADNY